MIEDFKIQAPPPQRSGVLITGGSGFLGHALVESFLAEGCERICIYSRSESRQAEMAERFDHHPALRFFVGDVRDEYRLRRAMGSVYSVIHAAALKRIEVGKYNPDEMVKTNVIGTMNVIEAARQARVGKVLLVSSDKAFSPVSPYGQSKALAESLVLQSNDGQHGPRFSVVRYGNVAGSTGSVIPTWRTARALGRRIRLTSPRCTRFWMSRGEAARLVLDTLATMQGGELAVPDLPAYELGDLATAMELDRHSIDVVGLGSHEKYHESMDETRCSETARRMTVEEIRKRIEEDC